MNDLERLEIWKLVSSHVGDSAPQSREVIATIRDRSWHPPDGETAQALLLQALLCPPAPLIPLTDTRKMARALLHPTRARNSVPAAAVKLIDALPPADRRRLIDALLWAGKGDTVVRLAELPTTEAIREVASRTGLLRGYKAYTFLESLGLSAVAPEPCHSRLFVRLGFLPESGDEDPDMVFSTLQRLSTVAKVPIREVAFVMSMFGGGRGEEGRDAARCLPSPECQRCPVARVCRHGVKETMGPSPPDPVKQPHRVGSDEELLERVLGLAAGELPAGVRDLVRGPLRLHSLHGVTDAQLAGIIPRGMDLGPKLGALGEILQRSRNYLPPPDLEVIRTSGQIWKRYSARFQGLRHEELMVVLLDTGMRIIREAVVSVGSLRECIADPARIFHEVLRDNAFGVMILHNHPSGSSSPSAEDMLLTTRILRSGKILGIPLLDHVVFGSSSHFSFKDSGILHELETDGEAGWDESGGDGDGRTD